MDIDTGISLNEFDIASGYQHGFYGLSAFGQDEMFVTVSCCSAINYILKYIKPCVM